MKNNLEALKNYLNSSLNFKAEAHLWKDKKKLPFFLTNTYDFFEITLFDNKCLVMFAKNESNVTPSVIRKHWEQVKDNWDGPCFYAQSLISSHNRLRLIQHQVPFVIPDKQIYLPNLGIDFRESFEKQLTVPKLLSPATQVLLIYVLLHDVEKGYTPSKLAEVLHYTRMTMTRAFNELEAAGIGVVVNIGKERWWSFKEGKRELWEQIKPMLRSPVRSRESMKYLRGLKKSTMLQAGISALADSTMINSPRIPIYVIGIEEYRDTNLTKGFHHSASDEADFELEIWNYNPKLLSGKVIVDPFSLYLSLRETEDERVKTALDELMEKFEW